jgi:hypothetical protein
MLMLMITVSVQTSSADETSGGYMGGLNGDGNVDFEDYAILANKDDAV